MSNEEQIEIKPASEAENSAPKKVAKKAAKKAARKTAAKKATKKKAAKTATKKPWSNRQRKMNPSPLTIRFPKWLRRRLPILILPFRY